MTTRSPDLAELLEVVQEDLRGKMRIAIPGRVESYDSESQTASVQPMVQEAFTADDGTEVVETLPIIQNVPVVFPRGGGFFIAWPLAAGDFVQLLVNDRSVDLYREGNSGDPVDPVILHRNDLTDAVAFPGFYPSKDPIGDVTDDRLVLGKDKSSARIEISNDAVEVTIDGGQSIRLEQKDGDAKLILGDAAVSATIAEHFETLYFNLKAIFDAHLHPTGVGPSGATPTPAPPWDPAIVSTKLTFPDG